MRMRRNAIEQIAREADAAGMSYGQYVAREYETMTLREAARIREAKEKRGRDREGKGTEKARKGKYQYKGVRICAVCGKTMVNAHPSRRYCDDCRDEKRRQAVRDRNIRARAEQKDGKTTDKGWARVCPWCGTEFLADTYARMYCSLKCSGEADRERRAERMRRLRGKETK